MASEGMSEKVGEARTVTTRQAAIILKQMSSIGSFAPLPGPPPFLPSPLKNESACKPEFKVAQGQKALEFPYKLGALALCRT